MRKIIRREKEKEGTDVDCLDKAFNTMSIKKNNKNEGDYDSDEDLGGVKKFHANANVFEIAGRTPEIEELLQDSVKLRVCTKLTQRLKRAGHRMLIFSQSKKMLDILQRTFGSYGMSTCRIDGSVTGRDRQQIIDNFNEGGESSEDGSQSKSSRNRMGPSICLLTTKACGQGITLTGADRVIIFDPSWNPAEDRQAVDRAFRIGQKKDVVVYRLIMASSVEEKMYEKQVFKDGIRVVTESGTSGSRYFSSHESKDLFTLGPSDRCEVMERLWGMTGQQMKGCDDTGIICIYVYI
jgi:SNF2 family DNA or RNA helicase